MVNVNNADEVESMGGFREMYKLHTSHGQLWCVETEVCGAFELLVQDLHRSTWFSFCVLLKCPLVKRGELGNFPMPDFRAIDAVPVCVVGCIMEALHDQTSTELWEVVLERNIPICISMLLKWPYLHLSAAYALRFVCMRVIYTKRDSIVGYWKLRMATARLSLLRRNETRDANARDI